MVDRERSRRRFLRASAGVLAVGVAGCLGRASEADPTPTPSGPAPTGTTASDTPSPTPTNGPNDDLNWPHRRRDLANTARAPAGAAPEPTGLSREWRYSTGNKRMNVPIVQDGLLVASCRSPDGDVFGLDAEDSSRQWVSRYDSPLALEPVFVSDTVFTAHSGVHTTPPIHRVRGELSPPTLDVRMPTVLRSAGGELVVGHRPPNADAVEVVGIEPGADEPTWRYEPPIGDGEITDIALDDGVLYVGGVIHTGDTATGPGSVSAYDLETGELLWKRREDSGIEGLAVGSDCVYVTGPRTLAIDKGSGEVAWTRNLSDLGTCYPAVGDDIVYAADYTDLVALDKGSGETVWEQDMNGRSVRPSIGGDAVYAVVNRQSDRPGKLAAFDAATGERRFRTRFGQTAVTAPVVANGAVYLGVDDGSVLKYA
jgi:outer membrane protein assembly factor BamB